MLTLINGHLPTMEGIRVDITPLSEQLANTILIRCGSLT